MRRRRESNPRIDTPPGNQSFLRGKANSSAFNAALRLGYITSNPCTALESLPCESEEKGTVSAKRELEAWWRRLANVPEVTAKPEYEKCRQQAEQEIDILLARAEKSDAALHALLTPLHRLLSGLHALAAHGNKQAAHKPG
jgi:hypothetical protein